MRRWFTGSAASLSLLGAPVTRQVLTFNHDSLNKYINMNVVGNSANLVWKGGGAGNPDAWNLNTTANFLNGVSMDKFYDLDHVLFNDTGSAHPVVALTGTLQPASLTVNATVDYTFGGTGKISGLTGLNKLGTGKLTLANTGGSDFVGTVAIGGGTLQIGDGANRVGVNDQDCRDPVRPFAHAGQHRDERFGEGAQRAGDRRDRPLLAISPPPSSKAGGGVPSR